MKHDPNLLLEPLFEPFPKASKQWYIEMNGKRFVRKTSKGPKWLWTSKDRAFNALCECISYFRECPLEVMRRDYPYQRDHQVTRENIEWYVNKLEEDGYIQFKSMSRL